jgi:protein AaeX
MGIKEINLDGIFIAPFVGYLFITVLIFIPVRILFDRYGVQRRVWHRSLFDASVFVIILSLIGLMF